jgi:AcrR family transcriptional regulator
MDIAREVSDTVSGSGLSSDRRSRATRVRLILAAETLFGEQGIDAVALRNISDAAGQRNNASVQYHFGGRMEILQAIFGYREAQLEPGRRALLADVQRRGATEDLKSLVRVLYEPSFILYRDGGGITYLRLLANYLIHHRPGGVPHPSDTPGPNSASFCGAKRLIIERLAFLGEARLHQRMETLGAMFLTPLLQHSARDPARRQSADALMSDTLEMMVAALCALPGPTESFV